MEYVKMNLEIAKQIGAFASKDLKDKTKPGDVIINCSTGETDILPLEAEDHSAFCAVRKNYSYYYKVVPEELRKDAIEILFAKDNIEMRKAKLAEFEKEYFDLRSELYKKLTDDTSTTIVLFCSRPPEYDMDPTELVLRPGDKLMNFGQRFPGRSGSSNGSLWIALIQVQGVYKESIGKFYNKSNRFGPNKSENSDRVEKLSKTGYKIGDKFTEGCRIMKVNNGVVLTTPVIRA